MKSASNADHPTRPDRSASYEDRQAHLRAGRLQVSGSEAIKFLRLLRPKGPWTITTIVPDGKNEIYSRTFTQLERAEEFIVEQNNQGKNVYYSINPIKGDVLKPKAEKNDIARIEYLQVDADPRDDESPDEFKQRLLQRVEEFPQRPILVVDSGNGIQLLWELAEPVENTGPNVIADIEARNHALAEAFGASPSTRDVCRIFRLPGTLNYPNKKKRSIGRVICKAELLDFEEINYPLSDFPPHSKANETPARASSERSDLPANLLTFLHVEGAGGYPSRHELVFSFLTGGIRAGVADDTMIAACLDQSFAGKGIHQHIKENGGRACAERQLQRAHEKVAAGARNDGKSGGPPAIIHSWEDPDLSVLDDRRGELPDFPIEVLPASMHDWVERTAHGTGITVDHVAVPLLGIASGMIGAARRAQATRTFAQPATLWTCTIGLSGTGKTPGIDATRDALAEVEHDRRYEIERLEREHDERVERAAIANAEWKKALKKAIDDKRSPPSMPDAAREPEEFITPRLYVSDTTVEKMGKLLLAREQGMLLLMDELAGLFENMSRYNNGNDAQFWLQAWDGKPFVLERMQRSLNLPCLLVGIVGGMQPDKMEVFDGADDGMTARTLWSWPRPAAYRPLSDGEDNFKIRRMLELLSQLPERERGCCIPLTHEAYKEIEAIRKDWHENLHLFDGRERSWLAKLPGQVLRVALTLTFMRWAHADDGSSEPERIELNDIKRAGNLLWNYFAPHAFAALRQIGLDHKQANARRLLRWLANTKCKQVSREEARRKALAQTLDADATQKVMDELARMGWLRPLPSSPGNGRPKLRWEVNPLLLHEPKGEAE
jgi:hypothetical protein